MVEKFRINKDNNGGFKLLQNGISRQEFDGNGVPVFRQGKNLDPVGAPCNCPEEVVCAKYYTTSSCTPDPNPVHGASCYTFWRPYYCVNGSLVGGALQTEACGAWNATSQVCEPLIMLGDIIP